MCINNTRGASELELLSISRSKSIRVTSKHIIPNCIHYAQSYLYILEDESITLDDKFLSSVDQLMILIFLCHNGDLQLLELT